MPRKTKNSMGKEVVQEAAQVSSPGLAPVITGLATTSNKHFSSETLLCISYPGRRQAFTHRCAFTSQADIGQVLALVFEQAGISDPKTACRMLQVSKACKAAMSCCQPCLEVNLQLGEGLESLKAIADFTFWLQRNGHLIKDLCLLDNEAEQGAYRAAESMLSFAFLSAASNGNSLNLRSVTADCELFSPAMLASLPAHSLTSLSARDIDLRQLLQPSYAASMQQLTALQTLELSVCLDVQLSDEETSEGVAGPPVKLGPIAFLRNLQNLNSIRELALDLDSCKWPSLQCLPPSVQVLKLSVRHGLIRGGKCLLDFPQLTGLQRLNVYSPGGIAEGSVLPPSVPLVNLNRTPLPADACRLLAGVQQLDMAVYAPSPGDALEQLRALRSLTMLSLT